jgi:calpain-15
MHGASAVAGVPSRLERVFLNNEISSNGIYGLNLYVLGVPYTMMIDDIVPIHKETGTTTFAGKSNDKALWGILIEKAFAKLHGSYEAIIAGDPIHSIQVLSGSPGYYNWHSDSPT